MTPIAWIAVGLFIGVYILIATERVHRVAAALGGAALVLGFGIVRSEEAFYSHETGIDWDVIFLLLGMMLVVGVIRRTGVFEFLAIRSAKVARGRPYRVLVLLVLVTAGASALLDNVTTVLLVAPVTLLVCDRLGLPPIPFLLAEALASNIGGAATLVGDPPNIIIASRAGPHLHRLPGAHAADRPGDPRRVPPARARALPVGPGRRPDARPRR